MRLSQITGPYRPKYLNDEGKEVEMVRNSAKFETFAGIRVLTFNEESTKANCIKLGDQMHRNNIRDLRAAIYQTGDDEPEYRLVKKQMVYALVEAEQKLLKDYLSKQWHLEEIVA